MTTPPPSRPATLPPPPGKPVLPRPTPTAPKTPARVAKTFGVAPWSGAGEGTKVVIYAASGQGKTTLGSMAPEPVFIGVDDGTRLVRDPRTNTALNAITGIESFADIRDAVRQKGLFAGKKSLVIDTITKVEELSDEYVFDNYTLDGGKRVNSIEGYGWGKGYRHSLEVMRLLLQDLDLLVRQGVNVVLLAQEASATMANAGGTDFLQAGPKLYHTKQHSTRLQVQEWADHVFRIDYLDTTVAAASGAAKGKIATRDTTRGIFTDAARHYFAKSRPLADGSTLPPVISFADKSDDSLWQLMFPVPQ